MDNTLKPQTFPDADIVLGAPKNWDAETHGPCNALAIKRQDGVCVSLWRLSWQQRLRVIFTGKLWLHVVSGDTQPPVSITTH